MWHRARRGAALLPVDAIGDDSYSPIGDVTDERDAAPEGYDRVVNPQQAQGVRR